MYNNKPVKLNATDTNNPFRITEEEAAVFFAQKLEQDSRLKGKHRVKVINDKVFIKNFFTDWKKILGKNSIIKDFSKVDFTPIKKYIVERSENKKDARKRMTKEEKVQEKEEKDQIKDIYGYALVDDIKIPIGSYMVQPPSLFIGHGTHPLRGRIKKRIEPHEVTLNVKKDRVPTCVQDGKPCKWENVVEDRTAVWIAKWKNPITQEMNYIWLKRTESQWVCMDDMVKFNKARKLDKNIDKIRKKYTKDMQSSDLRTRQLATAVYLLDGLAIRPGTEKDEGKEAGTLGLTTLKCENFQFQPDNKVKIDFAGKSSIQFSRTVRIDSIAYRNLQQQCRTKKKTQQIFPLVTANTLNSYLKTLLPDISAKVFRTWKASSILQKELDKNIPDPDDDYASKKLIYERVSIQVAKDLNHKRMTDNTDRIKKLKDKIKESTERKKKSRTPKQKTAAQRVIDNNRAKLEEAEQNLATNTSKVNYLDPRITIAWAKKGDVPIEKIYSKDVLKKFVWAMETAPSFKF